MWGAENDEGGGGGGVEELREQDAAGVGVGPGDEDADGGHGGGEGEEERKPVGGVGRGGAKVVDDGDVPGAPKQAEEDGGSEGVAGAAHFWEGETHPADFFEESGDKTESDADEEAIGGEVGGDESFHTVQNGEDQGWREEKRGVPAHGEARAAHARKKVAQAAGAVDDAGQDYADEAGAEEHGGEHHEAGEFWDGFAAEEMRGSYGEGAEPGDSEGEGEVRGDGVTGQEIVALGRDWICCRHFVRVILYDSIRNTGAFRAYHRSLEAFLSGVESGHLLEEPL